MSPRLLALTIGLATINLLGASAQTQSIPPTPGPIELSRSIEFDNESGDVSLKVTRIAMPIGQSLRLDSRGGIVLALLESGGLQADPVGPESFEIIAFGTPIASSTPVANENEYSLGTVISLPANAQVTFVAGSEHALLVVIEFGGSARFQTSSTAVESNVVLSGALPTTAEKLRMEITRQTFLPGATLGPTGTGIGRLLVVESGAADVELSVGEITVSRSYGGLESIIAQSVAEAPVADPEPDADHDAGHEVDSGAAESPQVMPLNGTVAGLGLGDIAILSGEGDIRIQGVGTEPSVVLMLFITEIGSG